MAAGDDVQETVDYLVSEGFQITFVPEELVGHTSTFLESSTPPNYRYSKEHDGSVSLIPAEEEEERLVGLIVESKPSTESTALLGEDKWVHDDVIHIREPANDDEFRVPVRVKGIPEKSQEVKFRLELGFSHLVKETTVEIKVDVNMLCAAVKNRFILDDLDGKGPSVFGYYVDRIDVVLSPKGLIEGVRPRTKPGMESSEVTETTENGSKKAMTASSKPSGSLELTKKKGRDRKIQTMRNSCHVSAEDMNAAGFRWEVIRWEHDHALEYNKIEPQQVWRNRSSVNRRRIELPYRGDGPEIQKNSFWAIWEVPKDEFDGDKKIQLKVDAKIRLRLLYQPKWFLINSPVFCSKSKVVSLRAPADAGLEFYVDAVSQFD